MKKKTGLPHGKDQISRVLREAGLAHNPAGWFVATIKDDWPAPLGYEEDAHLADLIQLHGIPFPVIGCPST